MRTILYIIQKEFKQVFRNRIMVPIIFVVPLVQMLILVYAANLELKRINLVVVDYDLSSTSRNLVSKMDGSPFFFVNKYMFSVSEAEKELWKDKEDVILTIPHGFEKKLINEKKASIQLLINAINGAAAGLTNAYSSALIADFNRNIVSEWINVPAGYKQQSIEISSRYWFNSKLDYKFYMVPAILSILVTIIGMFLTALNMVREKEIGTIEQINVTPILKYQYLIGKLMPFWIIALFELSFGLTIGKLLFHIPIVGSLPLLFGVAAIYLLVALGIGLFISTLSNTHQQVMFITFFFFLSFILMSGIFTPTESMPRVAQAINIINPITYFMRTVRMILLKGSGFVDVYREVLSLLVYAVIILSLAVWRYRKVS